MTKKLKDIMQRAEHWPERAQDEALEALREIEEDFVIGPETRRQIDEARAQARRGEGISHDELMEEFGFPDLK